MKVRFTVGVVLLLLLVGTPFFYLFYNLHRDASIESLKQATTDMNRLLLHTIEQSMFQQKPHILTDAVARLGDSELVQRVLIVDKAGRVAVSSDPRLVGTHVSQASPTCRVCHGQAPASRSPATIVTDEQGAEVFRTMRPVYNQPACYGCHVPSDVVNGVLMLDYSTAAIRARVQSDMWRMVGLAAIMVPLTLAVIALLMNRLVGRRVLSLVRATQRVRGGDFGASAPAQGSDELAALGESFNAMTAALRDSIQETERQRSYLEHVIDSIEEQVCVVDRSLQIVTANRSFVNARGLWKATIVGQPCAKLVHGDTVPCDACPALAVFVTGAVQKTRFAMPGPGGGEREYEVYCSPLRDGAGQVSQAIEVWRDVTERTSLEANLRHSERLASLGLLASGISHEINNPLASIAACVGGLRRQVRDGCCDTQGGRAALLEYLELVSRETMRAKGITERLLILSRPSTGLTSLVDLNRAIEETNSLLRFHAEQAGVAIATELQDPLPLVVADEGQVRQLVLNLVLNAVQAAASGPRGPGRVVVKTRSVDGTLELSVLDNGPGIEPGDTQKIFEPFYSRRAQGPGTGLGLFIGQAIVRGLRGTIRVSSWPGEGAAFIVEVPLHDPPNRTPDRG